jgi:putative hemolysin
MTPLLLFLLACAAIYFGTVSSSFTALMRLSLRLLAERNGPGDRLGRYLEEPALLFVSVRIWLAFDLILVALLLAQAVGTGGPHLLALLILLLVAFDLVCEQVVPAFIVRRNPDAVLEALLPSFNVFAHLVQPLTRIVVRLMTASGRERPAVQPGTEPGDQQDQAAAHDEDGKTEGPMEGEERRLLQSIIDFGDTVVREVMTPRPDIVAIDAEETLGALRRLLREQEYSRVPVFKDTLDNIVGFVFVKDLIILDDQNAGQPTATIMRPAYFVPETKRVSALLKEFQRQHTQMAIVVDEYGGTAGLVTIEDLLEEIVGEIRDEYDVETEPITDEGNGVFVVSGKVNIDDVGDRLNTAIEREGFETVGGYLLSHLGRVPTVGETFDIDGLTVEVLDAERRRVTKVRIRRRVPEPEGQEG